MKIMRATLILFVALAAMAFADDSNVVSSANIVGYIQTDSPEAGKFNIVSLVQFSDGSNTVHIQDAINNLDQLNSAGTDGWDDADKLIIWNGDNYEKYGLFHESAGSNYWMESGGKWDRAGRESPADAYLSRGFAVWYISGIGGTPTNFTTSGDVYLDDTFDVTLNGQLSILSYPYSSSINLTNLVISNATAAGTDGWDDADKIIVFTGLNYEKYGLFQPPTGSPYWMESGGKWDRAGRESPDTLELDLGSGFWYVSPSGVKTIGFTRIYDLD